MVLKSWKRKVHFHYGLVLVVPALLFLCNGTGPSKSRNCWKRAESFIKCFFPHTNDNLFKESKSSSSAKQQKKISLSTRVVHFFYPLGILFFLHFLPSKSQCFLHKARERAGIRIEFSIINLRRSRCQKTC